LQEAYLNLSQRSDDRQKELETPNGKRPYIHLNQDSEDSITDNLPSQRIKTTNLDISSQNQSISPISKKLVA